MAHIREQPPLRQTIQIEDTTGRAYRWAEDEPDPANRFRDLTHSSTMPGGFEQCDLVLPRKPEVDYQDLERLSTLRVFDAAGAITWEGRLERAPRVSGDQLAISPGAVGWQAHLEDNKGVREIYVDRDLSHWRGNSSAYKQALHGSYSANDATVAPDASNDVPTLATEVTGPWLATSKAASFGWYDGAGIPLNAVHWFWTKSSTVNNADANWTWTVLLSDLDNGNFPLGTYDGNVNLRAAGPSGLQSATATTTTRMFSRMGIYYTAASSTSIDNVIFGIYWKNVAVFGWGSVGLGKDMGGGVYGVDAAGVLINAISRWAPLITATTETVLTSPFIIPQLAFLEPTTVAEIIRQVSRYRLEDWAVWDGPTFYWNERNARGNRWRARVAPAQLQETGPQVERLWESVMVQYQDVDGTQRMVGPPGSTAETISGALKDRDPEHPANKLGITRQAVLTIGTNTPAGAISTGQQFLENTKLLDSSGSAQLVGSVEDDHGVLHPATSVRAGDQISFVDAADTSYRRIVRASHDYSTRTCNIDLDAPPEALQALLERLDASIADLGT